MCDPPSPHIFTTEFLFSFSLQVAALLAITRDEIARGEATSVVPFNAITLPFTLHEILQVARLHSAKVCKEVPCVWPNPKPRTINPKLQTLVSELQGVNTQPGSARCTQRQPAARQQQHSAACRLSLRRLPSHSPRWTRFGGNFTAPHAQVCFEPILCFESFHRDCCVGDANFAAATRTR